MQRLIKRLEVIRAAIALEDRELIVTQMAELKRLYQEMGGIPERAKLQAMVQALKANDYPKALQAITDYLQQVHALIPLQQDEIGALRLQLAALERELDEAVGDAADARRLIEQFQQAYEQHLSPYIKRLLQLKSHLLLQQMLELESDNTASPEAEEKRAAQQAKRTVDEDEEAEEEYDTDEDEETDADEDDEIDADDSGDEELDADEEKKHTAYEEKRAAYEETRQQYQEYYQQTQQSVPPPSELTEEDGKRLKKAFRQASQLCHPDKVSEENKAAATEVFKALNKAYRNNDLQEAEAILERLKNGDLSFTALSQSDSTADQLRAQINKVRARLAELQQEWQAMQEDDTWQLIVSLQDKDNWQDYFEQQVQLLKEECQSYWAELASYFADVCQEDQDRPQDTHQTSPIDDDIPF